MTTRKRQIVCLLNATESIGTSVVVRGQSYRLDAFEPREGRKPLVVLTSECAECGQAFATKTPLEISYLSRRCEAHKQPGNKVANHD